MFAGASIAHGDGKSFQSSESELLALPQMGVKVECRPHG